MFNDNVMFSIIIPTYNNKKLLLRAIKSVVSQSYKNYEVIVIDDGSTDGTRQEIKKYENKIRYFYQKNQGVSIARNRGIEYSNGDYIMFLDSDDYIECNALKSLNEIIHNYSPDFVKFSYVIKSKKFMKKNKFKIPTNCLIKKKDYRKKIYPFIFLSYDLNPIWNIAVKKKLINNEEFDCNLINAEDLDFEFKLLIKSNNIFVSDLLLYNYMYNPDGISQNYDSKKSLEKFENNITVYKKIYKQLPNNTRFTNQFNDRVLNDFKMLSSIISHNSKTYKEFYKTMYSILEKEKISKNIINIKNINFSLYIEGKIKYQLKRIKQKIIVL